MRDRLLTIGLLALSVLPIRASFGQPMESLARLVPADVGLYIEGRSIDDLLEPLTEPQAWLTLAELAGQPARLREAIEWRLRVRETVAMTPTEAIDELFARQFAFVGEGPGRAQDAVVICRPQTASDQLVARWPAQPLPTAGKTSVYRLPNRVGLARPDGLMMFGDAGLQGGMFQHVLEHLDADQSVSLARDPVYRGLLQRVPRAPDAVLFARIRRADGAVTTTAPAGALRALPGPLRGANSVLLALHRNDKLLHFSAVGDAPFDGQRPRRGLRDLAARLPARTLVAWAMRADYEGLSQAIEALPERSAVRLAYGLQSRSGAIERLAGALGAPACLAVGVVEPQSRIKPAPPVPAAALLLKAEAPDVAAREVGTLLDATVSVYNLLSLKVGAQPLPTTRPITVDGQDASLIDLTNLIVKRRGGEAVAELHVCWAVDGDVLILASHVDWLRQILAARHGEAETLAPLLQLSNKPVSEASETIVALQTGPVADLSEMWLGYLEETSPAVLSEDWWRARQPGGRDVRLGIRVVELSETRRVRVTAVETGLPADGLLRPGDEIVGINQRRFSTTQPVSEIRKGITQRDTARWVDLMVERGGRTIVRRLPLPFVDPIRMLRRAVAVGDLAQRVVYHDGVPDEAGPHGCLTVELRRSAAPLFQFEITPAPRSVGEQTRRTP